MYCTYLIPCRLPGHIVCIGRSQHTTRHKFSFGRPILYVCAGLYSIALYCSSHDSLLAPWLDYCMLHRRSAQMHYARDTVCKPPSYLVIITPSYTVLYLIPQINSELPPLQNIVIIAHTWLWYEVQENARIPSRQGTRAVSALDTVGRAAMPSRGLQRQNGKCKVKKRERKQDLLCLHSV